ncbi:MAG: hypothetical protein KJO82_07850 [Gammaproteobacteria bacterium]|nr:hypothetical protein [Gammaproteobacteria bacterium]
MRNPQPLAGRACWWAFILTTTVSAETNESRWDTSLPVYLTATAHYAEALSSQRRRIALSGLVELKVRRGNWPWSVGPIAEIRHISGPSSETVVSAGAIFRHWHVTWDTTAVLVRQMSAESRNTWIFGARVRYRVSQSGKLGGEIFGDIDNLDTPILMLGYYGDLSRTLSFRILGGATINQQDSGRARAELVWQIR